MGMKWDPMICPECQEPIAHTWEKLDGKAELEGNPKEGFEWGGYTDVMWDGQETHRDQDGKELVGCDNYHEWWAKRLEEESVEDQVNAKLQAVADALEDMKP